MTTLGTLYDLDDASIDGFHGFPGKHPIIHSIIVGVAGADGPMGGGEVVTSEGGANFPGR